MTNEVVVDGRVKISLAQLNFGINPGDRYRVELDDDGCIYFVPVVSVPKSELKKGKKS